MTEVLVVAGPTGSGKSALALAAAEALGGEVIGCDSVQIYRDFDIGSATPTIAERARVPHHLVDSLDWREDCDAARYAELARAAIAGVQARGKVAVVAGGTGLYLRALLGAAFHANLPKDEALRDELRALPTEALHARLTALDPARAAQLHPNDRFRVVRAVELATLLGRPLAELAPPPPPSLRAYTIVLDPERAALHAAIAARTGAMLAQGLIAEVECLLARGVDPAAKPMQSIGYKQTALYLQGSLPLAALPDAIIAATRQYAKRQTTWFKKVAAAERLTAWDVPAVVERLLTRRR